MPQQAGVNVAAPSVNGAGVLFSVMDADAVVLQVPLVAVTEYVKVPEVPLAENVAVGVVVLVVVVPYVVGLTLHVYPVAPVTADTVAVSVDGSSSTVHDIAGAPTAGRPILIALVAVTVQVPTVSVTVTLDVPEEPMVAETGLPVLPPLKL